MIPIFWCTTFELKGRLGIGLSRPGLLELFPESDLEHFLYNSEGNTSPPVLPGVVGYIDTPRHFLGFAFE